MIPLTTLLIGMAGTSNADQTAKAEHCTVSLERIGKAFEGTETQIDFSVHNPTEENQQEVIEITRGSRKTIYQEQITLKPGETVERSTHWDVRHDASGHSLQIKLSGDDDQDAETINGRSTFQPAIEFGDPKEPNTIPFEYRIRNTGSAPDNHEITITHDGEVIDSEDIWLGIDSEETGTVTIDSEANGKHKISVATESDKVTETIS